MVTLKATANKAAVDALLRSLTFSLASEAPTVLPRSVGVVLTDGDGGTSATATKTVNVTAVNDAPLVSSWDTTVTYVENAVPVVLDANAFVTDVDSLDFAGGKLTVRIWLAMWDVSRT